MVHRDLKLDNLLIHFPNQDSLGELEPEKFDLRTEPFEVKIADFGYSRELEHGEKSGSWYGSPLLMAPESLFSQGYDHKVDVWACGILYFQLITGYFAFQASDIKDLARKMKVGDWAFPKCIDFSIQGLDFLNCTLQYDQKKRLNWGQLVNHKYLTMAQGDVIPLQFKTNEETGELLPIDTGDDDGDLVSVKGSVINVNTRNSVPYK